MDLLAFAEKNSAQLVDHSKFADAKAGALITLMASIGAAMSVAAKSALDAARASGTAAEAVVAIAGLATLASGFITTWFCLSAIVPRIDKANALSSFPDIAGDPGSYVARVRSLSEEQMLESYCRHNAVLAGIARDKFEAVRLAVRWTQVALGGAYVFMVAYGIALALGKES